MAEPFIGEVRMAAFPIAPRGWALCNGQLLPINQNQALFSILGTTYGGNGVTTFALPNLQGRVPLHAGPTAPQGSALGEASHTLSAPEMPAHNHLLIASTESGKNGPAGHTVANAKLYATGATADVALAPQALGAVGGTQPHENRQPFTTVNFIIALVGIFPSRS